MITAFINLGKFWIYYFINNKLLYISIQTENYKEKLTAGLYL